MRVRKIMTHQKVFIIPGAKIVRHPKPEVALTKLDKELVREFKNQIRK